MLVNNLQDMIKKNAVSMVDMVDQLNIKKQRLDAILKRFSFLKNCPVRLPLPTVPQSIENQ